MLSFEKDIKPMISEEDRNEMLFAFDLWDYADFKRDLPRIAERVRDKSMPPGGGWPDDWIAKFDQWITDGMLP
ncbi:MAG: hypothetical protein FD129_874 [bacterium]|nr:MAG: hypothetical protein FD129_874 [bacterium]